MSPSNILVICLLCFWCYCLTVGALASRILIAHPYGSKSHQNTYISLAKELAHRGHHITVITNYVNRELDKMDNVFHIWMDKLPFDDAMFPSPFEKPKSLTERIKKIKEIYSSFSEFPTYLAETTYGDPQIQHLIQNELFDLVITSEVCGLVCQPFGWLFNAPTIVLSPNVLFPGRAAMLGDDDRSSYVPAFFTSFSDQMSFHQRLVNLLLTKSFEHLVYEWHRPTIESIFQRIISPARETPNFHALAKNVSLIMTNTHPSFTYPRSLPPQVIEVGGLHCRPAQPLPEELDTFLSSASEEAGFLVFAIGSVLKMEDIPDEVIGVFFKSFAKLPQRVIWQWNGQTRSDLPRNVLAVPWLPQQDLLGQRDCRGFLTHGGLNSLQEAIYHGVPVIGFPFGSDQTINIGRAVKEGYALQMNWNQITEETLDGTLYQLLYDPKYKKAVDRLSNLYRDQSTTPLDRAVFWTEFTLRHNGADHLRLGSIRLASYQRSLLDVYLLLVTCSSSFLVFVYLLLRRCLLSH